MIIVALKGGLGNQLFQYAFGKVLSLKNSESLFLDTSGLDRANKVGDIYRPYTLSHFAIKAEVATPEQIARLKYPLGPLSRLWRAFEAKVLKQNYVGFIPSLLTQKGSRYLEGYFQSPKYFESIRSTLLDEFSPAEPLSPEAQAVQTQMHATNSVSLHVRRGDYVTNKAVAASFGPCGPDYYERGVAEMQKHVSDPTWFVFSDDIAWVREHMPLPGNVVYVSDTVTNDYEELLLMRSCKHNIIANSTFSWWGAWLNQNPSQVVVAPDPWFDKGNDDHKDLIPASWIRVAKH